MKRADYLPSWYCIDVDCDVSVSQSFAVNRVNALTTIPNQYSFLDHDSSVAWFGYNNLQIYPTLYMNRISNRRLADFLTYHWPENIDAVHIESIVRYRDIRLLRARCSFLIGYDPALWPSSLPEISRHADIKHQTTSCPNYHVFYSKKHQIQNFKTMLEITCKGTPYEVCFDISNTFLTFPDKNDQYWLRNQNR